MKSEAWLKYLDKCVAKCNSESISDAQKIKKWRVIDKWFSIQGGQLTPTLKIRRKIIQKELENEINALYA